MPDSDWRIRLQHSRIGQALVIVVTTIVVVAGAFLANRPSLTSAGNLSDHGAQIAQNSQDRVDPVSVSGRPLGSPPAIGEPAPQFETVDIADRPVSLSTLSGKPVWLAFGATWCTGCRTEAPEVQAAYAARATRGIPELEVVSVYLAEDRETVADFAGRLGLTFAQVPDRDTAIAAKYRVMGVPAHFFIGRDGRIRSIQVGTLTPERIDAALATIR